MHTCEHASRHETHCRIRELDTSLGRWSRQDPAGYVDGANLYLSFGLRPTSLRDPLGRESEGDQQRKGRYPHPKPIDDRTGVHDLPEPPDEIAKELWKDPENKAKRFTCREGKSKDVVERTTDVTIYSYAEWHHNVPCSTEGEGKPPDGLRSELHKTTCAYTHTGTITYRCIDKYYQVVKVELDDWGGKDENGNPKHKYRCETKVITRTACIKQSEPIVIEYSAGSGIR